MSNLYKSGFIAFSEQSTLVIDANQNRVLRQLEEQAKARQEAEAGEAEAGPEGAGDSFQSFEIENIDMINVRAQADAIFEDARTAAEKIIEEARAQALILKEEAKQNGMEEGYRKGYEEAQAQLDAREEELQNRYESIRQQLEEDYEQQLREAEPKLVDVICRLLHKLTGVLVEEQQDVLVHIIDNAMKDIESSGKISIKVSEEDYADVYSHFDWIRQLVNSNVEVELVSDAKLEKLECLIETESGIINCGLSEQLDHLITSLQLLAKV
ncbi:MAG: FliH/SctL family protein [Bacteroides sp.]|nr:FliH/SctL family protein [Bacteroides sp.]MCM1550009.1 FliH/SctL family protein [Clostridium sp.]